MKKVQTHKEVECEKKQGQLREVHETFEDGKQTGSWYLTWQSGTAESNLPAGGDSNKKQAGFPDRISKNLGNRRSKFLGMAGGEQERLLIKGMTVFHSPPAQRLRLLVDDRTSACLNQVESESTRPSKIKD